MNMVRNIIICLLLLSMNSCNYLDKQPDDMLIIDQVFTNRKETEQYLANVFSYLPDESDPYNSIWLGAADEATFPWTWHITASMKTGNYSPMNCIYDKLAYYYEGIRAANVFMSRVDECTELTSEERETWRAEALFLRAYYHFTLLKHYGPIYCVAEAFPVDTELAALQVPRNTFDECVDFIVQDLDDAIKVLPAVITNDNYMGKPTKGAAMAIKARLLLYAASNLYNGNTLYSEFRNKDGQQLINQTYDRNKWKRAADAALELIETGNYDLCKKYDAQGNIDPYSSYQSVFLEPWNKEVIFTRPSNNLWEFDRFATPRQINGANGTSPTQQQVDAYFMNDGKSIEESSLYSENGFSTTEGEYTKAGTFNMYCNREPRFYASICYNGSEWIYNGTNKTVVELHFQGASGKVQSENFSPTGYLLKKMVSPAINVNPDRPVPRPWIYCRLAEVYLNYAEAQNEYEYSNSITYPAPLYFVNLIRERAGIPQYGNGPGKLPIPASQAAMRAKIRAERRVELAFECHRFFDTRRWMIAETTDGGEFWGMDTDAGTSVSDPDFYKRTVYETRQFSQKHYLQPITQYEIDRNPNCVQNPGW